MLSAPQGAREHLYPPTTEKAALHYALRDCRDRTRKPAVP
jgi:hypothetical protein